MNKTIIHTCSSVLIRPNGIVRYINTVIAQQKALGHTVLFVTDAAPTQHIVADQIVYANEVSTYVPNWKGDHVWLQFDPAISNSIKDVYTDTVKQADLVISHDLHSYMALKDLVDNGIFIQHESDVLTPNSRWSYLSDEYLAMQIDMVNSSNWRIGNTVASQHIKPPRSVYSPIPFTEIPKMNTPKTKGLLYVGDTSERKGAREFMAVARELGVQPTVITHDYDDKLFADADVHSFALNQRDEMYYLMSQHRVAYISSRNECPGLVVPECLQFMPVVVNSDHKWTEFVKGMGAVLVPGVEIVDTLDDLLYDTFAHDRRPLESWAWHSRQIWNNLVA